MLAFVLQHATLQALLTPTKEKWVGCHTAANSAAAAANDPSSQNEHLLAIDAWINCVERLIPDEWMRDLSAIGAYDVMGKMFSRDAVDILKQVGVKQSL